MDFSAFDTDKLTKYREQAKASFGTTKAWQEFEQKEKGQTMDEKKAITARMMDIFASFGEIRGESPSCPQAQTLVKKLQDFITEHFYTCTDEILKGLGEMYAACGDFTENIDRAGGSGTAGFVNEAVKVFCQDCKS